MTTRTKNSTAIIIVLLMCIFAFLLLNSYSETVYIYTNSEILASYKLSESIACVSFDAVYIYSSEGDLIYSEKGQFDLEKSSSDGENLALVSGEKIRIFDKGGFSYEITAESEILDLSFDDNILIIVTDDHYYSRAVAVYENGQKLFTRYVADAVNVKSVYCDKKIIIFSNNNAKISISVLDIFGKELYTQVLNENSPFKLYVLGRDFVAVSNSKILFFTSSAELLGEFEGEFSNSAVFDNHLYIMTPNEILSLNSSGEIIGSTENIGQLPRKFGVGDFPTVIFGKNATVFTDELDVKYTIENEFIPENFITYRGNDILIWKTAVVIYRK